MFIMYLIQTKIKIINILILIAMQINIIKEYKNQAKLIFNIKIIIIIKFINKAIKLNNITKIAINKQVELINLKIKLIKVNILL